MSKQKKLRAPEYKFEIPAYNVIYNETIASHNSLMKSLETINANQHILNDKLDYIISKLDSEVEDEEDKQEKK